MAREILSEDPTLIGFDLWDGQHQVAHRKREGLGRAPEARKRRRT